MKCLVVVLASFLVASALGNDYSDCELAEGIDYLHSVVAEEAGCCGVYYHECGGFDFGAVRQMLDNDAAFWNCLKEYKSVKLKNLKKKIGQIVEDSEGLFPTLAGRSITELEEDRMDTESACPWNTGTGTWTGSETGRMLDEEDCLGWETLTKASEFKFMFCVFDKLGDSYPGVCPFPDITMVGR